MFISWLAAAINFFPLLGKPDAIPHLTVSLQQAQMGALQLSLADLGHWNDWNIDPGFSGKLWQEHYNTISVRAWGWKQTMTSVLQENPASVWEFYEHLQFLSVQCGALYHLSHWRKHNAPVTGQAALPHSLSLKVAEIFARQLSTFYLH